MEQLVDRIFSIQTEEEFEACVWEVFHYQLENCAVYREYVFLLNKENCSKISEIPFLPIEFFKTKEILSKQISTPEIIFKSSGTGNQTRSKHFVAETTIYERSFLPTFEKFAGDLENCVLFALLPSYVSQGESSLVYMVQKLIEKTKHSSSGFYLEDFELLEKSISELRKTGKRIILFGVSYALLDFSAYSPNLSDVLIIETGGMKGRRVEMSKFELHETLKKAFQTNYISSEYGMCELLSQAYAKENGSFEFPNWMRAYLREVNDPLSFLTKDKTGAINIIDLANIYSCSFIATQDLGRIKNKEIELMGRIDNSDLRGCNLLLEEK